MEKDKKQPCSQLTRYFGLRLIARYIEYCLLFGWEHHEVGCKFLEWGKTIERRKRILKTIKILQEEIIKNKGLSEEEKKELYLLRKGVGIDEARKLLVFDKTELFYECWGTEVGEEIEKINKDIKKNFDNKSNKSSQNLTWKKLRSEIGRKLQERDEIKRGLEEKGENDCVYDFFDALRVMLNEPCAEPNLKKSNNTKLHKRRKQSQLEELRKGFVNRDKGMVHTMNIIKGKMWNIEKRISKKVRKEKEEEKEEERIKDRKIKREVRVQVDLIEKSVRERIKKEMVKQDYKTDYGSDDEPFPTDESSDLCSYVQSSSEGDVFAGGRRQFMFSDQSSTCGDSVKSDSTVGSNSGSTKIKYHDSQGIEEQEVPERYFAKQRTGRLEELEEAIKRLKEGRKPYEASRGFSLSW